MADVIAASIAHLSAASSVIPDSKATEKASSYEPLNVPPKASAISVVRPAPSPALEAITLAALFARPANLATVPTPPVVTIVTSKGTNSCIPSKPMTCVRNSLGYSVAAPKIALAAPQTPSSPSLIILYIASVLALVSSGTLLSASLSILSKPE